MNTTFCNLGFPSILRVIDLTPPHRLKSNLVSNMALSLVDKLRVTGTLMSAHMSILSKRSDERDQQEARRLCKEWDAICEALFYPVDEADAPLTPTPSP